MKEYIDLCNRIINEGTWVTNKRTGKRCLTVIDANFTYDVSNGNLPVLTTKKLFWKPAIAEMLGYLRGYTSAADFRALGCNTWNMNANENEAWLNNPHRKGTDDMGVAYGSQGRAFMDRDGKPFDQLAKIINNLSNGYDDRREILTFWNPAEIDRMCLPACIHTHTFSILNDELYLTSYMRSCDTLLGLGFNQVQIAWLLMIMAQITGLNPAKAFFKIVNVHMYEDQIEIFKSEQLGREPYKLPTLSINPDIKTLKDLETWVTLDDFELHNYEHHPAIKYPFSV